MHIRIYILYALHSICSTHVEGFPVRYSLVPFLICFFHQIAVLNIDTTECVACVQGSFFGTKIQSQSMIYQLCWWIRDLSKQQVSGLAEQMLVGFPFLRMNDNMHTSVNNVWPWS